MDCPSSEILKDYVEGRAKGIQKQEVFEHIADCPACIRAVRALSEASTKIRPPGATIIGWLLILGSISGFLSLFILVLPFVSPQKTQFIFTHMGYSLYDPLIWVGMFFLGRGLLKLQRWSLLAVSWIAGLACIVTVISILIYIWGIESIKITLNWEDAQNFVINAVVFYYFTRPKVKGQFRYKEK